MSPRPATASRIARCLRALPAFVFAALFAPHAAAYLDPGTGSILLQGLIAGLAAAATFLSLYWQKAKALWRSWFGGKSRDDGDDAGPR
jgi:hypothetical protein